MDFKVYDSPTRYLFKSSKKDEAHLVDLLANDMIGECSCEHFQFKLLPALDAATRAERAEQSAKFRCKHILTARNAVTDIFLCALKATSEINEQ
jgi:hypothetical protein